MNGVSMLKYTQTIYSPSLILKGETNGLGKKEAYKAIRKKGKLQNRRKKYKERWNYKTNKQNPQTNKKK